MENSQPYCDVDFHVKEIHDSRKGIQPRLTYVTGYSLPNQGKMSVACGVDFQSEDEMLKSISGVLGKPNPISPEMGARNVLRDVTYTTVIIQEVHSDSPRLASEIKQRLERLVL